MKQKKSQEMERQEDGRENALRRHQFTMAMEGTPHSMATTCFSDVSEGEQLPLSHKSIEQRQRTKTVECHCANQLCIGNVLYICVLKGKSPQPNVLSRFRNVVMQ